MSLVGKGTEGRAGKMQRWAIAPPAIEDDNEELEEVPFMTSRQELEGPETLPPTSSPEDPEGQVELPSGWRNEERDTRTTLADDVGPRSSRSPATEPGDTIPAPPWLGDE